MFKTLMSVRFAALLETYTIKRKDGTKRGGLAGGLAMMLLIGVVYFMMFFANLSTVSYAAADPATADLFFSVAGITSFIFCFTMTALSAGSQLFDSKDNDLLLSMPIKPGYIVLSRMFVLAAMSFFIGFCSLFPAEIIYISAAGFSLPQFLIYLVLMLAMTALSMTFSMLFGWLLSFLLRRMKRKDSLMAVVSLVVIIAVYFGIQRMSEIFARLLIDPERTRQVFRTWLFPIYSFGSSASLGGWRILIFLAIGVIPAALLYLVIDRTFVRIATSKPGGVKKSKGNVSFRSRSAVAAFTKKEMSRVYGNAMVFLNTGMGGIFALIYALFAAFGGNLNFMAELGLEVNAAFVISLLSSLNIFSASSISLEGRMLMTVASFPVEPKTVLRAKMNGHVLAGMPLSLAASAVVFVRSVIDGSAGVVPTLFLFVSPILAAAVTSGVGLCINLRFNKLDWDNELVAVKQNMGVMLAMIVAAAGVIAAMIPTVVAAFLGFDPNAAQIATAVLFVCFALISRSAASSKWALKKYAGLLN